MGSKLTKITLLSNCYLKKYTFLDFISDILTGNLCVYGKKVYSMGQHYPEGQCMIINCTKSDATATTL